MAYLTPPKNPCVAWAMIDLFLYPIDQHHVQTMLKSCAPCCTFLRGAILLRCCPPFGKPHLPVCHNKFAKTATATECLICTQRGARVANAWQVIIPSWYSIPPQNKFRKSDQHLWADHPKLGTNRYDCHHR